MERNEVGGEDKVVGGVGLTLYRGYSGQASLRRSGQGPERGEGVSHQELQGEAV